MKKIILLLLLCASAQAQSRADIGLHLAGDKDLGYQSVAAGISGRVLFDIRVLAIDAGAEWVFHAPKVGPGFDGQTLFTDVLVRRNIIGTIYVVGGIDVNKTQLIPARRNHNFCGDRRGLYSLGSAISRSLRAA